MIGSWTLFKLGKTDKDWIMLKHKDEFVRKDRDVTKEDRSVLSGRTIEEIRSNKPATSGGTDRGPQAQ